jgi:ribosomal protein L5
VINISSSRAVFDKRRLIPIVLLLEIITGQTGLLTQARCSLST